MQPFIIIIIIIIIIITTTTTVVVVVMAVAAWLIASVPVAKLLVGWLTSVYLFTPLQQDIGKAAFTALVGNIF